MDAPGVLCTNLESKILLDPKTFFFTGVLKGAVGQKPTLVNLRHSGLFYCQRGKIA